MEPLDREEKDEHSFKVRAVDGGGRYCEADIHITVEDLNDNSPHFSAESYTITVFENTEIGTYVGKLLATDADTGEFWLSMYPCGCPVMNLNYCVLSAPVKKKSNPLFRTYSNYIVKTTCH